MTDDLIIYRICFNNRGFGLLLIRLMNVFGDWNFSIGSAGINILRTGTFLSV